MTSRSRSAAPTGRARAHGPEQRRGGRGADRGLAADGLHGDRRHDQPRGAPPGRRRAGQHRPQRVDAPRPPSDRSRPSRSASAGEGALRAGGRPPSRPGPRPRQAGRPSGGSGPPAGRARARRVEDSRSSSARLRAGRGSLALVSGEAAWGSRASSRRSAAPSGPRDRPLASKDARSRSAARSATGPSSRRCGASAGSGRTTVRPRASPSSMPGFAALRRRLRRGAALPRDAARARGDRRARRAGALPRRLGHGPQILLSVRRPLRASGDRGPGGSGDRGSPLDRRVLHRAHRASSAPRPRGSASHRLRQPSRRRGRWSACARWRGAPTRRSSPRSPSRRSRARRAGRCWRSSWGRGR